MSLLHHYFDEKWLQAAYQQLSKDSAPDIDGQTVSEYGANLEENVKSLLKRAKQGTYKAPEVRGTRIPKPGSKEYRPLGIPGTEELNLKGV